ncbi:MAG TPA: DUF5681 domain-containing protein [Xanthobacteraceae bacterium]|nr:DUF5681 domain-containing protein [Xanthobacteraceae bacterium]
MCRKSPRDSGGRRRPGHSGNPSGRPPGSRNKATLFAEALFDHDLEILVRQAIDRALKGDRAALKLCIDRILAPRRRERVAFDLPPLETAADAVKAQAAILLATAEGALAPSEARDLSAAVTGFLRSIEAVDFEQRLTALEADRAEK